MTALNVGDRFTSETIKEMENTKKEKKNIETICTNAHKKKQTPKTCQKHIIMISSATVMASAKCAEGKK